MDLEVPYRVHKNPPSVPVLNQMHWTAPSLRISPRSVLILSSHLPLGISGCLNDTIWRNKYLRQETKVRIYKSVIRPDLTYAAGTCADTSKTKHILETTEMNTSGKRVGKARLDRVRNQDIRSSQYENWYIEEGRIK
jgi:hypothetical protein